jgi:hypothetical protein
MEYVESLDQLDGSIHRGGAVFIFFYRESANLNPQFLRSVPRLARKYPKVESFAVDVDEHPSAAGQYLAYTLPMVSLYYGGHLFFMKSEPIFVPDIEAQLRKVYTYL